MLARSLSIWLVLCSACFAADNPGDIASCHSWYDFSDPNNRTDDGTDVSALANKADPNVGDLTQAAAGNQPELTTLGPNGLTAGEFIAADQHEMQVLSNKYAYTQAFEVWLSVYVDPNDVDVAAYTIYDGNVSRARLICSTSGSGLIQIFATSGANGSEWPTDGAPHVFRVQYNGASTFVEVDGADFGTSLAVGSGGLEGLTLGRIGGSTYPTCKIGEIAVFDSALSTDDRDDMRNYFARWTTLIEASGGVLPVIQANTLRRMRQ